MTELRPLRRFGVFLALLVVIVSACSRAPAPVTLEEFTDLLDGRVERAMDRYGIPGAAVALVEGGAIVWSAAYGHADRSGSQPITVGTLNRTESISKSVTSWGVMTLVEAGRIGLDDRVAEHLHSWSFPESPHPTDSITVRHLLTNTSGMPLGSVGVHYPPTAARPSLRENLSEQAVAVGAPGEAFLYSNVGFNILEVLIEDVTGEAFADYLDRAVLAPLGMDSATFQWSADIDPLLPNGHDLRGRPIPPYVYPEQASGGLLATVEDVARFVAASTAWPAGMGVLSPESVEMLHDTHIEIPGLFSFVADSYGLGHFVETLPSGQRAVWHGGQGSGWMTHFHAVPETGDGIVILTNSQRSWPMISVLLSDWASWRGLGGVGMGVIARAVPFIWGLTAVFAGLAIWQGWRVGLELRRGRRRLAPMATDRRGLRLIQASAAFVVLGVLVWAMAQEYFFLWSIFPRSSEWMAWGLGAWAVTLLVTAVAPRSRRP